MILVPMLGGGGEGHRNILTCAWIAVPTEVIKWNADPEFTPLNATEFLDPKVQAKWETLFPGMAGCHRTDLLS